MSKSVQLRLRAVPPKIGGKPPMPWTIVDYHPVSLFSLRPAETTASGGQSLLVPTAFALKMAILHASIQMEGIEEGQRRFPAIRDLRIALCPPDHISVSNVKVKLLRQYEAKKPRSKDEEIARLREAKQYPFHGTLAYREFVQFGDATKSARENMVRVACYVADSSVVRWLKPTLLAINYLGKRGGFFQAMGEPAVTMELGAAFSEITRDTTDFFIDGIRQNLDDCGTSMSFEHADVYHPLPIRLGMERVIRQVVLPYRELHAGQDYSVYERIPE